MKILLIEDDQFFREFYAAKLREKNIEVDEAVDGVEGLAKINSFLPDLILLDIIMPNMDGFGVLTEMGKLDLLAKIPVLIFSTLGQEKDVEKARQMGAKGYVNKSFFDFDKLYSRILEVSNS